ncbi:MAG: hypothetical protein U9O64_11350 [Campylobacterota bacterium]|nr:hypothetical protein [Campylobacterota bacterium]
MIRDKNIKNNDVLQPEEIVGRYYDALYKGDLESVREMMTEASYMMTLEPFGIKLSFNDSTFKTEWDQREERKEALHEVEKKISKELLSRKLSPQIEIKEIEAIGLERRTVHYSKDGKNKKLYFSKEGGDWYINYFAGRPTPPQPKSYFSSVKSWIKSIIPSFK